MQTFTGTEYLMIDIANNFGGLDKLNWDDRIQWVKEHESELLDLEKLADKPALFYAGVKALKLAREGKASGYPISLDATSSGVQILSLLTECEKSARLCNVINTGKREDFYKNVHSLMQERVGDIPVDYKLLKKAAMTAFYASEAQPKLAFGEGVLLDTFYDVLTEEAPGAWELNEAMKKLWNPNAYSYNWTLPDDFHVNIKVIGDVKEHVDFDGDIYPIKYKANIPQKEGRSLGANMTHSVDGFIVREMQRRCNFDPKRIAEVVNHINSHHTSRTRPRDKKLMTLWNHYKVSGYLSVRILDYLDHLNMGLVDRAKILELIGTLPKKPFDLVTVHDCFRVLPNYGNDVRMQYNTILSQIAGSEMLAAIVSQIRGRKTSVLKKGSIASQVLQAEYALS